MQTSHIDRKLARALVEAGYMPLSSYIHLFGSDPSPDIVPSLSEMEDVQFEVEKTLAFLELIAAELDEATFDG